MAEKPKALRLADEVDEVAQTYPDMAEVSAELRRLVAENALLHERHHFDNGVLKELLEALRLTSIDCQYLHHAHKDRHLLFEECPVVARINAAIAKAEGQA